MFKTVKTSELTGAALDWAAAKCEFDGAEDWDGTLEGVDVVSDMNGESYRPSTDWAQGGPIIERECMDILCLAGSDDGWQADKYLHTEKVEAFGPTPLIAAMRCYVASKLGDSVEVPEELLKD